MKKFFAFLIVISLVLPLFSQVRADSASKRLNMAFVGNVTAINSEEKSFDLKVGGFAQRIKGFFAALFSSGRFLPFVYKVLTNEDTSFRKKSVTGVVNGSFEDLKIGLLVQVRGSLSASSNSEYKGVIKANTVFILTPSSTTTTTKATTTTEEIAECIDNKTKNKLTLEEALKIAERDCGNLGKIDLNKEKGCNSLTGTWLLGFVPNEMKEGCNPVCEVNVNTKTGKIIWRCTVLLPSYICEVKCDLIGYKSEGWYAFCKDPITGETARRLIRFDNCRGCQALCKYPGTPKEGWYSSCDNKLIWGTKCSSGNVPHEE
ncbi:MAG: hypothetical protein ACP5OX_00395 [Minisyncoccia bacterium]